ncbi:hypothetical protein MAUB1S_01487 [Mycolicibacterium aubagnense]
MGAGSRQLFVHMIGPTSEFAQKVVALCGVVIAAIQQEENRLTQSAIIALNQRDDLSNMYQAAIAHTYGQHDPQSRPE